MASKAANMSAEECLARRRKLIPEAVAISFASRPLQILRVPLAFQAHRYRAKAATSSMRRGSGTWTASTTLPTWATATPQSSQLCRYSKRRALVTVQDQLKLLNTNSRYLHPLILEVAMPTPAHRPALGADYEHFARPSASVHLHQLRLGGQRPGPSHMPHRDRQ